MRRALRCAAAMAAGWIAACSDATPPLVPTTFEVSASTINLDAIGATQSLTITVRDQHGAVLPSAQPTLASSSPAVATVSGSSPATVTATGNGSATITISAGRATTTVAVVVAQVPTSVTAAAGNNQTSQVGAPVPIAIAARVADRLDVPVPNASVTFTAGIGSGTITGSPALSNAQGIATVGAWTLGTTPGVKSAAATVSGVTAFAAFNATATVGPAAVLAIYAGNNQVSNPDAALAVLPAVRVSDQYGNAVAGTVVTFAVASGGGIATGTTATSSSAGIATVGSWVMGSATGTNTLTASSPGLNTVTFTASAGIVPVIASVTPTPLVPGGTMTVTGSGFAPTTTGNTLRVGGATATVTSAASGQITATVPCVPSGNVAVTVTAASLTSNTATATLLGTPTTVALGQAFVATSGTASRCIELPATGSDTRYLVSIFNTSTSPNSLIDFELGGNPATSTSVMRQVASLRTRRAAAVTDGASADLDRAHWEHLERERALVEAMRARGGVTSAAARRKSLTVAAVAPAIGDRRVFTWNYGGCTDTTALVTARVLYAGSRAIIWEDTSNAILASANAVLADRYQRIGRVFDLDQYEVVRTTFGDPLRRDPVTDNDGRVHMLFTHRVNEIGGVAAFVTSADQYPRSGAGATCAASNFGEFFYGSVPTQSGSNLESSAFPDGWFNFMGRTVVHEVKHIASMASRVDRGVSLEQSWLEEGTARHAEEVWTRQALHHAAFRGNSGYGTAAGNGLYCDFNSSNATCLANDVLRRPSFGVRRQFNELRPRLLEPWNWSPFGDVTGQSGGVFYQTSWSLVRYAIDLYGTSDAAFLTALTNSSSSGATNLATVAGVSMPELIGGWTLALYADDYPGLVGGANQLKFQTWNLRDIYNSLNADPAWSGRFNTPYPIVPTPLAFGAFTAQQIGVRGGANAYFELSGTATSAQVLNLRAIGGGASSTLLRIAIARLR